MATQSIDNALMRQFSDMFHIEAEQKVSKTSPYVQFKSFNQGEDLDYKRFGKVKSQQVKGRNPKIEFADADFSNRQMIKERFTVAVPIDASDLRSTLLDPQGPIIRACMAELNRVKDRIVVKAAFADVKTGRDFSNTLTFAQDNGSTVDATAGFTYEKLLEISDNFKKRDVDMGKVGLFITEQEHNQIMKETELTSSDFITQKPIPGGVINSAVGMDMIVFGSAPVNDDPILNVVSTTRDNIAIAMNDGSSGICVGMSKDINIKVQERADLIETTQVVATLELGAVRTEGVLVQKIQSTIS